MKIVSKTYVLLAVIIGVSLINLFVLLQTSQENEAVLHSISSASNLKVTVERIAGTANSIASGNDVDRQTLTRQITDFENTFNMLGSGGQLNGITIVAVPDELRDKYANVGNEWNTYKQRAEEIRQESVFNPDVKNALKYILEKDGDLITLTNGVYNDLLPLDRNYNRHKEIATELVTITKSIGENTLLISIGERGNSSDILKKDRIMFNADLKKLEGLPIDASDSGYGVQTTPEILQAIPRENAASLRALDPLWESVVAKIKFVESTPLLSAEFGKSLQGLETQRDVMLSTTGLFVDGWNKLIDDKLQAKVNVVLALLVADIAVFIIVMLTIRKSLNPLAMLTSALSRVKEGFYGEKIDYTTSDEIGTLAHTFNLMSETIQKKEEEAKKVEIAKDEFLAMITHELKTPLVPIQGYADILLGEHLGHLNKNQKERLEVIKSSSATLLQLISDLLDAQKLELGQLKIVKQNDNLKDTISRVITLMTPQAALDEIELVNHVKTDVYAYYDEDRINQVFTNLIKNSFKATPKKGKVEIFVEDMQDEVKVSVKDNGIGLPNDALDKIFRKFYQVDTSSTREKGGSGLGLSICKGIIEAHGGKMWVESELGKGATFSFMLAKIEKPKSPL
ncbi:MAG TPA: HAMP domain-containing sensor histidine kinase [Nitrosopumilaceae archaeon]|nr:HAMP domain-containing sensor histidine kinase [Nitrosopumilaceae archaeon]